MHSPIHIALTVLTLATSAVAQAPIIVDASGGPGSSFTSIQTAIEDAPAGARIVVRAGVYGGFVVDKNLSIVARSGVTITSGNTNSEAISIDSVPANWTPATSPSK